MRRHPVRTFAATTLLAVLAALGTATSAGAIAGLQMVQQMFPGPGGAPSTWSQSVKQVVAQCPAGKKVIGAAGSLFMGEGAAGQVILDDITPDANLTKVTATAVEDADGWSGYWAVRAHAFCATPPQGLERVTATGPTNSKNKLVVASCPTGKRMLGGGGDINGTGTQAASLGRVVLSSMAPNALLTQNTVTASEAPLKGLYTGSWSARSYAICANPPNGLHRAVATSVSNASDVKSLTATCSSGFRVHGVGGAITSTTAGAVHLSGLAPSPSLASQTVLAAEGQIPPSASWFVRSYAICAE